MFNEGLVASTSQGLGCSFPHLLHPLLHCEHADICPAELSRCVYFTDNFSLSIAITALVPRSPTWNGAGAFVFAEVQVSEHK